MSKKWKIVVGIVVVLVIVGCVTLPIVGMVFFRDRFHGIGWEPILHRWEDARETHRLEVELIDDDEDGVPDRRVIEFPAEGGTGFDRGRFVGGRFVHGRNVRGHLDHFGPRRAFGPFFIVGGLVRLACLAGVIVLGVVFYRKWRKVRPEKPVTE